MTKCKQDFLYKIPSICDLSSRDRIYIMQLYMYKALSTFLKLLGLAPATIDGDLESKALRTSLERDGWVRRCSIFPAQENALNDCVEVLVPGPLMRDLLRHHGALEDDLAALESGELHAAVSPDPVPVMTHRQVLPAIQQDRDL